MKRTTEQYLQDVLDSIQQIQERISGITEQEFLADEEKSESVTYRLAVIGEH